MTQGKEKPRGQLLQRDPVLWIGAIAYLAIILAYVFPGLDPEARYRAIEWYSLIPILLVTMAAPWVALPPVSSPFARHFWGAWTFALFMVFLVNVLRAFAGGLQDGWKLGVDVGYVLFYLSIVLALQVKPGRKARSWFWRRHDLYEVAGTGVFVFVLLLYFVLIPRAFSPDDFDSWIPSLILYFSLDVFIFLNLVYLRQTCSDPGWRIAYTWLALAAATWAATDSAEVLTYLGVISLPPLGPLDFLWYIPWIFVLLAARIRAHPVPSWFATVGMRRGPPPEDELLARPGWLVISALALPFIHFGVNLLGVMDPSTRNLREVVVLGSLLLLLTLSALHRRALKRRALTLLRKNREGEEYRKLLAAAVEKTPDAILIADADGTVQYANPAWKSRSGEGQRILGAQIEEVLPKDLVGGTNMGLASAIQEGVALDARYRRHNLDGEVEEEIISVSPVRDEEGRISLWVVIRNDVTYLAQLERQLSQAQKMESLGTLAGGIAHDFNNILGAIYGYGELLSLDMESDSTSQDDLRGLLTAAERAAELVSQILTFSRQGEELKKAFALESVVQEALSLLRATLPSTIEIKAEIEGENCTVLGVRHQVHQVLLNLGTNAAHAMGESGGILEVSLRPTELSEEAASGRGLSHGGPYLLLRVRDTGEGMDQKVMDRIFDPFFTTKEVGKGTGLGLSVVHGTVSSHGGGIWVESESGVGTTFEILLPCADPREVVVEEQEGPPPPGSGQRILVVDDEPMLASLAEQILRGLGYEVERFTESEEALARILGDSREIDALVTDQTMPHLTGLELARKARDVRPDLPILLTTGYSENLSPERLEGAGVNQVLLKPHSRGDLGWAVADLFS